MNTIRFPGLGLEFNINPVITIGNFSIRWYGVIIAIGFLLAVIYTLKKCEMAKIKQDDLIDMLIFAVPISIIGARTYYCVFMFDTLYYYDYAAMFRIWEGGLAIYGAIIAAVITCIIVCRIKRIRIGAMLDIGALGLLIGQSIGRWGNFVNQEAYGQETDSLLRMEIYVAELGKRACVQPTFLYESVWNAVGFLILHLLYKKRRFHGEIFLLYTTWYGIGRGVIEGMRSDSLYFFSTGLRVSQFWGFFSAIIAIGILVYLYLFHERNEEGLPDPYLPKKEKKLKEAAVVGQAEDLVEDTAAESSEDILEIEESDVEEPEDTTPDNSDEDGDVSTETSEKEEE